ncbi:MAG: hypothetical protein ACOYZ8_15265 [Chloroflexota bacterium]
MEVADWILIGTTLFLGAVAIWGESIRKWIERPKIIVSFKESNPFCHKTYYRNEAMPNLDEPVFFFRFKVENTGKTELRRCEGVLSQLWKYDSAGRPQKVSGFIDVSLRWAQNDKLSLADLDPYRSKFCNIGHLASPQYQQKFESGHRIIDLPGQHDNKLRFLFEQAEYPHSQPNCLIPGTYAIKVILYSENAPPVDLWFQIAWSGNWQDEETEIFRELVITQISKLE